MSWKNKRLYRFFLQPCVWLLKKIRNSLIRIQGFKILKNSFSSYIQSCFWKESSGWNLRFSGQQYNKQKSLEQTNQIANENPFATCCTQQWDFIFRKLQTEKITIPPKTIVWMKIKHKLRTATTKTEQTFICSVWWVTIQPQGKEIE